jgi:hypothetical protein
MLQDAWRGDKGIRVRASGIRKFPEVYEEARKEDVVADVAEVVAVEKQRLAIKEGRTHVAGAENREGIPDGCPRGFGDETGNAGERTGAAGLEGLSVDLESRGAVGIGRGEPVSAPVRGSAEDRRGRLDNDANPASGKIAEIGGGGVGGGEIPGSRREVQHVVLDHRSVPLIAKARDAKLG